MKKIFFVALFASCIQLANAQLTGATLVASGLTCSMCSKAVYKAIAGVSFVASVKPDISASSYDITFKKDAPVDPDVIRNAVEAAGFSVAVFQVQANVSNIAVSNDAHVVLGGNNYHFINVPSKTVNGMITLTVIDRKFISDKEYKKFSKLTSMKCYATGVMENCCKTGTVGKRIYHVTIS